jgi:formylglycine-generating enzyme required for sulfatase activity
MKKIAGVPLILIGGSLVLLAMLILAEDEGYYTNIPQPRLSTVLIACPIMVVGFGMMMSGVKCFVGDSNVAKSKAGNAAGQPDLDTVRPPSIENSLGMVFKVLPAGSFVMGSPRSEYGKSNYISQRSVTVASQFLIGVHPVTQSQYEAVMGENPSRAKGENNPVEMVTWDMAVAYCRKLSGLPAERAAGREYRLPTEAEWEYACRAGTTTTFSFGDDARDLVKYAWFIGNLGHTSHAVGGKLPNRWGLYDMLGNVWEWCSDDDRGLGRVARGGSRSSKATDCQSTSRHYNSLFATMPSANFGFRVALNPTLDLSRAAAAEME